MQPGMDIEDRPDGATLHRDDERATIDVAVWFGEREPSAMPDTGIVFLNHALELIATHGAFNISAAYAAKRHDLQAAACEEIGQGVGRCIARVVERRRGDGVACVGEAHGIVDGALAVAVLSLDGRAGHHLDLPGALLDAAVEDATGHELARFLEGFAMGAGATVHMRVLCGSDAPRQWQACFVAFARALRAALASDPWRAEATAMSNGSLMGLLVPAHGAE